MYNNAVVIVKGRWKLTEQCLRTFREHSHLLWNMTVVVDGPGDTATAMVLRKEQTLWNGKMQVVTVGPTWGVLGQLKTLGVKASELRFGRGEFLYVMDNDGYYTQGWDTWVSEAATKAGLVGPYRHPYHHPTETSFPLSDGKVFKECLSVQGIGHMMQWEVWDECGPYHGSAEGTNKGEDHELVRRVADSGALVGVVDPDVVYNCGLTDSYGRPCVGIETMGERKEGVYYE